MKAARDRIGSHFDSNMGRVMHLLALHGVLEKVVSEGLEDVPPRGDRPDLLRASVVLLHATLEDLVRGIAEWKLPHAASKAFERVQIAFPGSDRAKERMTLAELANFRGRTIDSVNLHLETATYNNLGDIIRLLDDLDIEVRIPGPFEIQGVRDDHPAPPDRPSSQPGSARSGWHPDRTVDRGTACLGLGRGGPSPEKAHHRRDMKPTGDDWSTAMVTKERVKQILETLDLIEPKVDILENDGFKILAGVVSPPYEHMPEGPRQEMVWSKLLEELGDYAGRWVEFVYTDSPSEVERRNTKPKTQAAGEPQA